MGKLVNGWFVLGLLLFEVMTFPHNEIQIQTWNPNPTTYHPKSASKRVNHPVCWWQYCSLQWFCHDFLFYWQSSQNRKSKQSTTKGNIPTFNQVDIPTKPILTISIMTIISVRRSHRINSKHNRRSPRIASVSVSSAPSSFAHTESHFFVRQSLREKKKTNSSKLVFMKLRTRQVAMNKAPGVAVRRRRNNKHSMKMRMPLTPVMAELKTVIRRSPRLAVHYLRRSPRIALQCTHW
jgi:hypothetical protein